MQTETQNQQQEHQILDTILPHVKYFHNITNEKNKSKREKEKEIGLEIIKTYIVPLIETSAQNGNGHIRIYANALLKYRPDFSEYLKENNLYIFDVFNNVVRNCFETQGYIVSEVNIINDVNGGFELCIPSDIYFRISWAKE